MLGTNDDGDAAPLRRIAKLLLPAKGRRRLRTLHRRMVFARAMRRFMAQPELVLQPGSRLLESLMYGWGNEGWSAREEYLAACVRQVLSSDGPILECGSGLSTLMLGAAAQRRGRTYVALEHLPKWADKVRRHLVRLKIDAVVLHTVPLRDFGAYDWYDAPMDAMPRGIELVICDGPPGGTRGGRYGLVPVMRRHLAPRCVIMIDDVVRAEERVIANRWSAELGAPLERLGSRKPYMRLTVPEAQLQLRA